MAWYQREDPTIRSVQAAFGNKTVEEVKQYVALLEISKLPTRKQALIDLLLERFTPSHLPALWGKLDELQKAAVAEVVHGPDTLFRAGQFAAKYGTAAVFHNKTDQWSYRKKPTWLAFFIHDGIMPDDLKRQLQAFVPPPAKTELATVAELPATVTQESRFYNQVTKTSEIESEEIPLVQRATERNAQQDLMTLLRLVEAGKFPVSEKTLRPSEATMKNIATLLQEGDFYPPEHDAAKDKYDDKIGHIKPFAWSLILQNGKLAELSGKKLALTKTGRKALGEPPHETLRALWQRWAKNRNFDEYNRVEVVKGQNGTGKKGMTGKEGRRQVIVQALQQCPPGTWIEFDAFSRFMLAANYVFDVTRDPWELYIAEKYYGRLGEADWTIFEERYLLVLLFEYAATLGLIDVAYIPPEGARNDYGDLWGTDDCDFFSRYDGLCYFRINPLGAYCLDLAKAYEATPLKITSTLTVLPSLKILVTGEPLAMDESLLLEAYADKLAATEWHLSLGKTMAAVESGRDVKELREFLEKREEQFLPETVERFLRDAADKKRRFKDKGTAFVMDCGSAEIAETLSGNAALKRLCLRAGESSLLVFTETEEKFRKALHALGYCWPRN